MNRITWTMPLLFVAIHAAAIARGDDEGDQKRDLRKRAIELPLEDAVAAQAQQPPTLAPKAFIERPTDAIVARSAGEFKNPKVAPGKVRWHASFAAARAAAEKSGRPVLLFQLMGNLDDRFC